MNNREHGTALSLEAVWQLAQQWYSDRMNPDFRGRTVDDAKQIFKSLNLVGSFWEI